MRIFNDINEYQNTNKAVITVGMFDGFHKGHQYIINKMKEFANKNNCETVVLTFSPHPKIVLKKDFNLKLIYTIEEKIRIFEESGIDNLIIHPFTKELSSLSTDDFIMNYLIDKLDPCIFVMGYDHQFGNNRKGNLEHIKEYGATHDFSVFEISPIKVNNQIASSTLVRDAINNDDIEHANILLGKKFSIEGIVEKGKSLGSKIGFPTANISIKDEHKIIPKPGVFAIKILADNTIYKGMLNIGCRPTIKENNDKNLTIEANIFNFNGNLYGKKIIVFFIKKFRSEIRFNNIEDLKKQLEKDKQEALKILKND